MADVALTRALAGAVVQLLLVLRGLLAPAAPRCGSCGKARADVGDIGAAWRIRLGAGEDPPTALLYLHEGPERRPWRVCWPCLSAELKRAAGSALGAARE